MHDPTKVPSECLVTVTDAPDIGAYGGQQSVTLTQIFPFRQHLLFPGGGQSPTAGPKMINDVYPALLRTGHPSAFTV